MKQVAALVGVSTATVSRAVHSPHLVRRETREKIQRIMAENDYVYNAHAADLSRRKTTMIGLILPTLKSSIHAESVNGMQQRLRGTKYSLVIASTDYDLAAELSVLSLFIERRLGGVILTGIKPETEEHIRSIERSGTPCVVTWETVDAKDISYVGFDNFAAAHSITEYLTGLGHTRIGLITGPVGERRVSQRLDGYKAALREASIACDSALVIAKEPTLLNGKASMNRLLSLPEPPTAVFAASDVLAVGALSAVREKGLRVPRDISVVGFDDIDIAAYSDPPLTTVRVPAFQMGQLAVQIVLEAIQSNAVRPQQYCLDTDLIIRASCSPPGSVG